MPTLTAPLLATGTAVVRLASRVRGERAIHAKGHALAARVVFPGSAGTGAPLLDEPGTYDAVVRLSRAIGLPSALPDVLGVAVRVVDAHGEGAHQDLLLDSTCELPLLRRLPLPGWDFAGTTCCSLLPYDVGRSRLLFGARAVSGTPSFTDVDGAPQPLSLALLVATAHGSWREVATLTTTAVLPAPEGRRLRFNPAATGGGIRPAGRFQSWRERAYPVSHVGPDT